MKENSCVGVWCNGARPSFRSIFLRRTGFGFVVLCLMFVGCREGERREEPSEPQIEPAPPPAPPPAPKIWAVGKWSGTSPLQRTELGSFAADKRGSQPGAPELSESLDASVALRVLVWDLEVSEVGAVRGSAAWEKGEVSSGDAEVTGPMLQVTGIAELPEGPARLKLSATWAHGVAMLRRKADSLQGTVRLSVDGGKDKSDLKIYEGTVRLLPTK